MNENLLNSYAQQQRYLFNGFIPTYNTTLSSPQIENKRNGNLFAENFRSRLSTVWSPEKRSEVQPPLIIQCPKIYYEHVGMLPSYGGHVPGEKYRFGVTFGNGTKDYKKWLRTN